MVSIAPRCQHIYQSASRFICKTQNSMERRRKATWAGNQLMYGASGASALCCKRTPKMKDVVENAVEHLPADPSDPSGKTRVVFHTDPADKTSAPYLRRSPCTLCLINTDTMAAGQKIWDRTSSINATKGDHTQDSVLAEGKHQMGDGKLNLMTWRSLLQFSLDIVCGQIGCTSVLELLARCVFSPCRLATFQFFCL